MAVVATDAKRTVRFSWSLVSYILFALVSALILLQTNQVHAAEFGACTYSSSSYNANTGCETPGTYSASSRLSNTGESQRLLITAITSLAVSLFGISYFVYRLKLKVKTS